MVAEKRIFFFSGIQEAKDKSRKQGFRKEHKNLRTERERVAGLAEVGRSLCLKTPKELGALFRQ